MSGQLKAIKNRIRGVENTKKITRAMEMVAASKLKRFLFLKQQATPYEQALEGILKRLLSTDVPLTHPLLEKREEKQAALFLITSDTGLCGSYNQQLVDETKKFLAPRTKRPLLIGLGKNGINALSRAGYSWHTTFTDIKTPQIESTITKTSSLMEILFYEKQVDAIYVAYAYLAGRVTSQAVVEKLLPFELKTNAAPAETSSSYIIEPEPPTLFSRLIPLYFETKVRMVLLTAWIAEQMARQNAMHQATENAEELLDTLVLLRNKMRQAAITKELIEIVSGSRALKQ